MELSAAVATIRAELAQLLLRMEEGELQKDRFVREVCPRAYPESTNVHLFQALLEFHRGEPFRLACVRPGYARDESQCSYLDDVVKHCCLEHHLVSRAVFSPRVTLRVHHVLALSYPQTQPSKQFYHVPAYQHIRRDSSLSRHRSLPIKIGFSVDARQIRLRCFLFKRLPLGSFTAGCACDFACGDS